MHLYRSVGVRLDIALSVEKTEESCWLAVRSDILPWVHHKVNFNALTRYSSAGSIASHRGGASRTPPPTPDDHSPAPSFKVDRLKVKAYADQIKFALWNGELDADGLCIVVPRVNVTSLSEAMPGKGLVSDETKIDLGGVKATLLDVIDCYDFPAHENHGIFGLLTKWHGMITEEEHIVEAASVVILDHPVEGEGGGVEELFREKQAREEDDDDDERSKPKDGGEGYRPTLAGFISNHNNLKPPPENLPLFSRNPKSPPQVSSPRRTRLSPQKKRATIGFSHSTLSLTHDTSISNLSADLDAASSTAGDGPNDEDDAFVTWTVLVRGMRLLWTLDIRDAVVLVVGDLLHTLELMSLQRKSERAASTRSRNNSALDDSTLGSDQGRALVDFGGGLMLPAAAGIFMTGNSDDDDDDEEPESALTHLLLRRKESTASSAVSNDERRDSLGSELGYKISRPDSLEIPPAPLNPIARNASSSSVMSKRASTSLLGMDLRQSSLSNFASLASPSPSQSGTTPRHRAPTTADNANITAEKRRREELERDRVEAKIKDELAKYRVTFQVHLTNPQVQLHSNQTSGSVVIGSQGAYIEGREFLKLVRDNSSQFGDRTGPSGAIVEGEGRSMLKKSEVRYMLDRVEAYAMPTDVDLSAGLQWLELVSVRELEKRKRKQGEAEKRRRKEEEEARRKFEEEGTHDHGSSDDENDLEGQGHRRKQSGLEKLMLGDDDSSATGSHAESFQSGSDSSSFSDEEDLDEFDVYPGSHPTGQTHAASNAKLTFAPPSLLRKMWHEFTIRSRQISYSKPLAMAEEGELGDVPDEIGGTGGGLKDDFGLDGFRQQPPTIDSLLVDTPELSFALDTEQFFTTLDVVRHVLLAPPAPKREYEVVREDVERPRARSASATSPHSPTNRESRTASGSMAEGVKRRAAVRRQSTLSGRTISSSERETMAPESSGGWWSDVQNTINGIDVSTKRGRLQMKDAMQEVISELEEIKADTGQTRVIKWGAGKVSWRIKKRGGGGETSVADDDVEVVLTNLEGTHDFYDDGSLSTDFGIGNVYVKVSERF